MTPRDQDEAALVAYVSGELDEAARLTFELRLAEDPALQRRLLAFEALDLTGEVLRSRAGRSSPKAADDLQAAASTRAGSRKWSLTLVGAVVAAAAALVVWLMGNDPATVACEVRLVASVGADDATNYARELGLPDRFQHPLGEQRGGGGAPQSVTIDEFLAAVDTAEAARSAAALATPADAQPSAAFFTVQLHAARECSALVLQLDGDGVLRRVYPAPNGLAPFGEVANRFAADRVHVLPRPIALRNSLGTLSLNPGFEIPSDITPRRAWLLFAVRSAAVPPELLTELDAQTTTATAPSDDASAAASLAAVRGWLEQRGFAVQQLAVRGD
ncbi:MAG: hypothetical protein R3F29_01350 [Planctomycetota bacterium]